MTLVAYHNNPAKKAAIIAILEEHRAADRLIKGQYWEDGKGCAVGCTIQSNDHAQYEPQFGIPVMLARLEDVIFEGLPNARAMEWPIQFMFAIPIGADLSRVGWQFLHWLLTDEVVNPGIANPRVRGAVRQCADVLAPLTRGAPVDQRAAKSAARNASAIAARSAVRSAATSAVWSAAEAAKSVESAAWAAAASARSASDSAAIAGSAAGSAASAARGAAYMQMADKLLALMAAAPPETKGEG